MALRDGAAHGVRIIAGSTRPEKLPHDLISGFTTRLLLHLHEEEHSIQLPGRPDAAELGADGDLLPRVGSRSAMLLRGFRVRCFGVLQVTSEARPFVSTRPSRGSVATPPESRCTGHVRSQRPAILFALVVEKS